MQKIITAALKSAFPGVNVDALVQVVSATPNPELATELLLGVWEPVTLLPYWSYKNSDGTVNERRLTEVDYWKGNAHYVKDVPITVQKYFPKGTTKTQAMELVGADTAREIGETYEYYMVPTGEFKAVSDYCTFKEWAAHQCQMPNRAKEEQLF